MKWRNRRKSQFNYVFTSQLPFWVTGTLNSTDAFGNSLEMNLIIVSGAKKDKYHSSHHSGQRWLYKYSISHTSNLCMHSYQAGSHRSLKTWYLGNPAAGSNDHTTGSQGKVLSGWTCGKLLGLCGKGGLRAFEVIHKWYSIFFQDGWVVHSRLVKWDNRYPDGKVPPWPCWACRVIGRKVSVIFFSTGRSCLSAWLCVSSHGDMQSSYFGHLNPKWYT